MHENARFTPAGWTPQTPAGFSRKHDFVDLSPLIIDPIARTCVAFANLFCYLGGLMDVTLSDLPDVNNRIQKSSQGFGMLAPSFFRSRKYTCETKRIVFDSIIASVCLYGCESWAVTAEIQRRLRSFQTQRVKQMLGVTTAKMIDDHVSAADAREKLGMKDVVRQMECLQLKWHGGARNVPLDRLPRKLLVSWLPSSRLRNYPQTQSQTVKKALATVGVSEQEFPAFSSNLREWNRHISQSLDERRARLHNAACDAPSDVVRSLARAAHHGVADINFRNSPLSVRRREFAIGGGEGTPQRDDPANTPVTDQVDLRSVDPRNCFDPNIVPNVHPSTSPESVHAQLVLDVGHGHRRDTRLSQNGIFCWRREIEERKPDHRHSWVRVDANDPDPRVFATRSHGPSTPAPSNPPHHPTHESCRPLRPDAPVFNPDAAVPVLHGGRLLLRTTLNSPPPSPPRTAERHLDF